MTRCVSSSLGNNRSDDESVPCLRARPKPRPTIEGVPESVTVATVSADVLQKIVT